MYNYDMKCDANHALLNYIPPCKF